MTTHTRVSLCSTLVSARRRMYIVLELRGVSLLLLLLLRVWVGVRLRLSSSLVYLPIPPRSILMLYGHSGELCRCALIRL